MKETKLNMQFTCHCMHATDHIKKASLVACDSPISVQHQRLQHMYNNSDNNNDDNNNHHHHHHHNNDDDDKDNNCIKRHNSRFFYSVLTAPRTVSNTYAQAAGT